MSKVTPSLPKGTRDFGPAELRKRNYIFGIIKSVFEKYGFQPIETPAMEKLETLEGKYGEEGDKLLFRILNSGDFLKEIRSQNIEVSEDNLKKITSLVSGKGLRYDLTIPFARYVVQHQHEITFPFKRYQIQPVWRADRPQKGRYREFYQCDADVVGSDSLLNEVELILIYDEVFRKLGLDVTIKYNSRKILKAICEIANIPLSQFGDVVSAIDQFDKVGSEVALDSLKEKRFSLNQIQSLKETINYLLDGKIVMRLEDKFKKLFSENNSGLTGLDEILFIKQIIKNLSGDNLVEIASFHPRAQQIIHYHKNPDSHKIKLHFDAVLARGLDYYTGTIFEVKANNVQMGSIGGGGRYDNLTGVFGLPNVSGVGISFGVERIYDVMEELKLFDNIDLQSNTTRALFINFGGEAETKAFQYLQQLRASDIPAEIFPSNEKMKKQIGYADKKGIPYAIFVGEEELKNETLQVKILKSGEQKLYKIEEVIELLKQ
ncbi:MAG: histidine--tRNA ligase [Chitinophagales bacterium]|nr:histidine--tRNA ligase [Chitinophagales bacterium]